MSRFVLSSMLVVSALMACHTLVAGQYTKADNCSIDAFESSYARAYGYIGITRLRLPDSEARMKTYCKNIAANQVFSKDYGDRCLTGTSQTLLNLQVYNIERVNKPFCAKNGKKRENLIEWSKCANKGKKDTGKCWDTMVNGMHNTRKVANVKSRLPLVCCLYYDWIRCNTDAWKKVCDDEATNGMVNILHKGTVDSMNLICNKYEDDTTKCAKFYEELSQKKNKKLRETPVSYIFDIFESL